MKVVVLMMWPNFFTSGRCFAASWWPRGAIWVNLYSKYKFELKSRNNGMKQGKMVKESNLFGVVVLPWRRKKISISSTASIEYMQGFNTRGGTTLTNKNEMGVPWRTKRGCRGGGGVRGGTGLLEIFFHDFWIISCSSCALNKAYSVHQRDKTQKWPWRPRILVLVGRTGALPTEWQWRKRKKRKKKKQENESIIGDVYCATQITRSIVFGRGGQRRPSQHHRP